MDTNYPLSVVALLINPEDGTILSVSRKTDHEDLGLPGGKVEPGETPEAALTRELFEETGVRVLEASFVFERSCGPGRDGAIFRSRCFRVTGWSGIPESREGARVAWVRPSRLLDERNSFRAYNAALFTTLGVTDETPSVDTPATGANRPRT